MLPLPVRHRVLPWIPQIARDLSRRLGKQFQRPRGSNLSKDDGLALVSAAVMNREVLIDKEHRYVYPVDVHRDQTL